MNLGVRERGAYLFALGVGKARPEVLHQGDHEWIIGVQEEHLLSSDDRFDVLQVHNNGVLATKDCGRVGQQRVQESEVAGWEVRSLHDHLFPDLQILVQPPSLWLIILFQQ